MFKARHLAIGLLLAVLLVALVATPALAVEFEDIDGSPYEASIIALASKGFTGGYDDNTFRPDNPLWRAQFAKMAVLTMGFPVDESNVSTYKDTPIVNPNNPLYPGAYVAVASATNIIKGYLDNSFGFYKNVTRQQVITMIVRAGGTALAEPTAGYQGELSYSDPTHGANIKKAEFNGLLTGIPDLDTWSTTADATRGEAAEMLAQLYYRTGVILTLSGPSDTLEFTAAELKALQSVQGYGGWKNIVSTIVGPRLYKGVTIQTLMQLVGGGTTVTVVASDGYRISYTADDVAGNPAKVFNPQTGDEIGAYGGPIAMIVTYEVDGAPLSSAEGALRIGFVTGSADQVTDSKKWVSQVTEIEVH